MPIAMRFLFEVRCIGDGKCSCSTILFEVQCSGDGKCRGGFDLLIEVLTGMRGQLLMG